MDYTMDPRLKTDIECQWHRLDEVYTNTVSLFGSHRRAWDIIYEDMINVYKFVDDFGDGLSTEFVVRAWWASLTPEDRDRMFV
jgi:hypothetical protein